LERNVCLKVQDGTTLHPRLPDGWVPTFMDLWWNIPFPEESASVSLPSIARSQIKISGLPLRNGAGYLDTELFRDDENNNVYLFVVYPREILLVFAFDESLGLVEQGTIPGGIMRYINHVLRSTDPNVTTNYDGPEPELTMRPVAFRIHLHKVADTLRALGVEIDFNLDE